MDVATDGIAQILTAQSLQMIDISDPAHLTSARMVKQLQVAERRVVGTRAYVSTSSGLDIVDVSDLYSLALLTFCELPVTYAEHVRAQQHPICACVLP